ncbi:hypothetical protein [Rhodococcus qingshengii]|uniref:hypothetical protein n=1 Tax=Rhodococcus qingshengii TaxID=334542 RepID=UPI0035A5AA8D
MASTLAKIDPARFGDESRPFTRNRGANETMAKTIPSPDGSFDILIDLSRFCNFHDDDDDEVASHTSILEHLAAHEPQHVLMHLSKTDSMYLSIAGESNTVNDLVPVLAEAVDEFRCELASNRIVVSGLPQDQFITDDLDHFREALNASVALSEHDRWAACVKTMNAAKEMLKALSYLAALRLADNASNARPITASTDWDRYLGSFWPDLFDSLATIPAADEEADGDSLASAIYLGAQRVSTWLDEIGVTYRTYDNFDRACLWQTDNPF